MVQLLSIIGALINAGSQVQYISNLVQKKILLNKVTWGISALVMLLQAGTYYEIVASGNPWIATASIVVAVSFVFIFLYSFLRGRYAKLTKIDVISFVIAIVTILIWQTTGEAVLAHLILQVAIVISFVPTIAGLFQGILREKPIPWFVSVSSYVFILAAILLQSGISNWPALAYPLVTGIGINGFIGILAIAQDQGYLPTPKMG